MNHRLLLLLAAALLAASASADEPPKVWTRQDKAMIGPEQPIAVVWSPEVKRFMSLGWISNQYDRRAPYTYDELAFDPARGEWENWIPAGKDWGPKFGLCKPPRWKGSTRFQDAEGNVRPNWPDYYWLVGAAKNYTYLPDEGKFLFYIDGDTFRYDPAARQWLNLATPGGPQRSTKLKTRIFWSSICYHAASRQVVFFGGGNSDTERGDAGTWLYSPADNTWKELTLERQPPQRANSQLVYDPVAKQIVLFGGDQLDQTIADTWTFDGQKWEQKKPAISPSPRAGHALVWLPKAKKVLLLGGYSVSNTTSYSSHPFQNLPLEAWTYDSAADRWDFLRRFEPAKENPVSPRVRGLFAAADADDQIAIVDADRKLWLGRLDGLQSDPAGAEKNGAKPGAVERRGGPYQPGWYQAGIPAADPAQVKRELADLPANRWVLRPTPKRPAPNMDWGSAVFSPELDQILRFSGGHSAYSGTAPQVYDVATDRYSIPFAPEFPIDWCFSNDQVPGEYSFRGNPWMTGHTYKSCGYEPTLKAMVFAPHQYTYFFDPRAGKWARNHEISPFRPSFYTVNLVTTRAGVVAWAFAKQGEPGLWRLDLETKTWQPLTVKGKLLSPAVDNCGFAFDSKRNRIVFFLRGDKGGAKLVAYDFATAEVSPLEAAGSASVVETNRDKANFREAIYLPHDDLILIGATGLVYDCAKNAWLQVSIPSDTPPITKEGSYNIGVMYDPTRNLVWAVNTNSQVFVLKFDPKSAGLEPLK